MITRFMSRSRVIILYLQKGTCEQMIGLSDLEKSRYSRHLLLPEVGAPGQQRLKESRVLVCGAGGLGAPVLLYLAAAGVGTIGVVDFDNVERSNLQRQIVYDDADVGASKAERAARRLQNLNPDITVNVHAVRLTEDNVEQLIAPYQVLVDGTDNFATRYLISDAAALADKPYVYGSIYRFEGQVSVFQPESGPCYRCLFPEPPAPDAVPNCAEAGVLGVLAGTIGSIQATECLKLLLNTGQPLIGRLMLYDALSMSFDVLKVSRNPQCPLCGESPVINRPQETNVSCNANSKVQLVAPSEFDRLRQQSEVTLVDVRSKGEYAAGHLPEARLIPVNELEANLHQLNPNSTILLYCRSGQRSGMAGELLLQNGFKSVYNLAGGLLARTGEDW